MIAGGQPGGSGTTGETVDRVEGVTGRGNTRVPLRDAFPRYESQATAALDRLDIPLSMRALVRAYFDSLAAER